MEKKREMASEKDLEKYRWWLVDIPNLRNGIITLDNHTADYINVSNLFYLSIPRKIKSVITNEVKSINSIIRIEKICRLQYREKWQKELLNIQLSRNNSKAHTYRKLLFLAPPIDASQMCLSDDMWISSTASAVLSGRPLGTGIYLSEDARLLSKYAWKTSNNTRQIFLVEAIVGEPLYTDSCVNVLPDEYDSIVGIVENHWVWVTPLSIRIYPSYLIEYNPSK